MRKNRNDHKRFDSQKHNETLELLKLMKDKKSFEKKDSSAAEKEEFSKFFELLQAQLRESRQIQDQILVSLKDKEKMETQSPIKLPVIEKPTNDDEKLIETNKFLSLSLQKLEDLYQKQEHKLKKYKEYKKFMKFGAYIECTVCHGLFKPMEFLPHAGTCEATKKPLYDSPLPEYKYEYKSQLFHDDQSISTTLKNQSTTLHHTSSPSLLTIKGTSIIPKQREAMSYVPSYEQPTLPLSYTSHLKDQLFDIGERVERSTKSFFLPEVERNLDEDYDNYSDNNEYNMPRPLHAPGNAPKKQADIKGFNKEENEILLSHEEMHHKDLNLPFYNQNVNTNYWASGQNLFLKDKGTAEGKLSEFNTTLFPDGEIKTMSYVKKKSKGSSKGSGDHDNDEQQGTKGLTKGILNDFSERRKSWNIVIKDETYSGK